MSEPPPSSGYDVPPDRVPPPARPDHPDPLIGIDYADWRRRNAAILKAYWRPLVTLQLVGAGAALILRIPTAVAQALGLRGVPATPPRDNAGAMRALGRTLPWLTLGAAGWLLASLVSALVLLASQRLVVRAVTGGQPATADALRGALRRLPPFIGWGVVAWLIVVMGLCACFLPALYFLAVFTLLPAVTLFEHGDALGRCFRLFHTDLAASALRTGTIIAIGVAAELASNIIGSIVRGVAHALSPTAGSLATATVVVTVADVVIAAGLGVLLGPLILTTYADLRARREPLRAHDLDRSLEP